MIPKYLITPKIPYNTKNNLWHQKYLMTPKYLITPKIPYDSRLREGRKIIGSTRDLFSSCFELPSPAGSGFGSGAQQSKFFSESKRRSAKSLPGSRRQSFSETNSESVVSDTRNSGSKSSGKVSKLNPSFCFEDHLFHGRVQLLKRLYSGTISYCVLGMKLFLFLV